MKMKKLLLFLLFLNALQSSTAQIGTEEIKYKTPAGEIGTFTVTQIRGTQNAGTVTNVSGSGTGGATVTVTNPTTTPNIVVNLSAIPNASLANSSVTIAGQTVSLGGSASIGFSNLTGSATLAQLPTGIPNTNLANSSVTVGGVAIPLGGSGSIGFSNLTGSATLAQLPTNIPNTNLANSAMTIEGVSTSLGGSYVAGSTTVTATGTDVIATKLIRCNAGASDITRTLPSNPTDGLLLSYKRVNATAGATIIVPNSGQSLSEGTQVKIVSQGRSVSFQYNLAATQWQIID